MKFRNDYILMRHGQTIYQTKLKDMIYPWPEKELISLTKRGEGMALKAGKKLKKEKIDLIFASDINRARQSSEIVGKELGIKPKFDKRLRDLDFGIYCGRLLKDFQKDFADPSKRFAKGPKGGECWNELQKRLKDFLSEIETKYQRKKILIISHGDPLWFLKHMLLNSKPNEIRSAVENKVILGVGKFEKPQILNSKF